MIIKNLIDEDFIQYRKPSMFIAMPRCSFKCDKESGCQVCQNSDLATAPSIEIPDEEIIERYYNNPITQAVVFGGLEPFDTIYDVRNLMCRFIMKGKLLQLKTEKFPIFVIYTGYRPEEIQRELVWLSEDFGDDVIIKFGRFIPNTPSVYDKLLGVKLSSNNQFALHLNEAIKYVNELTMTKNWIENHPTIEIDYDRPMYHMGDE